MLATTLNHPALKTISEIAHFVSLPAHTVWERTARWGLPCHGIVRRTAVGRPARVYALADYLRATLSNKCWVRLTAIQPPLKRSNVDVPLASFAIQFLLREHDMDPVTIARVLYLPVSTVLTLIESPVQPNQTKEAP